MADADAIKEEGLALFRRGERSRALARFEEAARAYEAAGDTIGLGEALNNVGVVQRVERNWQAAIAAFERAAQLFHEGGDGERQAKVAGNLGDLHAMQGERDVAAQYYRQGAELFAEAGAHDHESQLWRALSLLRLRQRRIVEALHLMERSLRVRPRRNVLQSLFHTLLKMALRLLGGGQW